MASKALIPFLVTMMLATGVCNTLLSKYQDMQCIRNCDDPNPARRVLFEQPVVQTLQMFIGEMGSWLVVLGSWIYYRYFPQPSSDTLPTTSADAEEPEQEGLLARSSEDNPDEPVPIAKPLTTTHPERAPLNSWRLLLLALPACCDLAATTLMNVGLLFVAASIYQMTRGALVLFVGCFSVVFLRRRVHLYQWFALVVVVLGVGVVGLAGAIWNRRAPATDTTDEQVILGIHDSILALRAVVLEDPAATTVLKTIVGVLLIAGAQIFAATQFVLEEWILENYALQPLKVVGWEGIFGFTVTVVVMVVMHLVVGRTDAGRYGYFDAREGWREITQHKAIAVSSLLIMISIGGFNFFGLSVTRSVSATARSTIDTCRTLFIWLVSLGLGWESFKWLQVVGFVLLVYGTFLFNDIIAPPLAACVPVEGGDGRARGGLEELLPEGPIEHI